MNDTATATARMLEGNLRAFAAHVSTADDVIDAPRMAELYAYAAECVTKRAELEAELDKWREREAAACPEDFGFEEVIASLRAEVERLRAYERFVAALDLGDITQVISKPGLRYGYVRVWGRAGECFEGTDTLAAYAAATREGADAEVD